MALNIRVESKHLPLNASKESEDRAFRNMMSSFKRKVNDCKVLEEFKLKQYHETKGEKRRRKSKESFINKKKFL